MVVQRNFVAISANGSLFKTCHNRYTVKFGGDTFHLNVFETKHNGNTEKLGGDKCQLNALANLT